MAILTILLSFFFVEANAADLCQPKNFKDLALCALERHPEKQAADLLDERAMGEEKDGRKLYNPELSYDSTKGKLLSETQASNRASVSYPIEIFGQRSARVKLGDATSQLTKIERVTSQDNLLINIVLKLYRYRQVLDEGVILDNGLTAYSKVIRMLSSRPRLPPENQASLVVFKLAEGDFRFRKTNLINEKRAIEDFFFHSQGLRVASYQSSLPPKRQSWPTLEATGNLEGSPYFKVHDFMLERAQARNEMARAQTWPTFRLALIAENNVSGANDYMSYGAGVVATIPLLDWNGGERQATAAEALRTQIMADFEKTDLRRERGRLLDFYNDSKKDLIASLKSNEVAERHGQVSSLYYKGLITSSLFVEAHRQLLDFTKSQNEIEIKTMEALMKIYALDSKLNTDIL